MLSLSRQRGFTLIELLVGMALLALLLALGMPAMREYAESNKLTSTADAFAAMLQKARTEAILRNVPETAPVEFMLTATAPLEANKDSFTSSATGSNWVTRVPDFATASTTDYEFIDGYAGATGGNAASAASSVLVRGTSMTSSTAVTSVFFNSLGQPSLNAPKDQSGALAEGAIFRVTNPAGGACKADGGALACLDVRVSISGEVRTCDPTRGAGDSRRC